MRASNIRWLLVSLFWLSGVQAIAGTPVLSTTPPSEGFVGEQVCFDATLTNSDPGEVGYAPYYRIILTEDFSLDSASFVGSVVSITTEGTFAAPPSNTLTDSVSGDDVTGPENATLYTVAYPIGSVTSGSPPLVMELCLTTDAAATIDVLQSAVLSITSGFALGNTATGDNGPQVGGSSTFDFTPRVITYSLDDATQEGERPPGPAWQYDVEACANIASDRVVNGIDFATIEPITLPNNVQFVGPITFTGTGASCTATTAPADLTLAPGGTIDLNCTSGTGVIGDDAEICATYPVYITDTLSPTSCASSSAINTAKHLAIQKASAGGVTPGGTRTYTANIQVSEFVPGITSLVVTDVLPDGVTFNDDATIDFGSGAVSLSGVLRTINNDTPGLGQTTVDFDISAAVGAINAAASGTLVYSVAIDQAYQSSGGMLLARDTLTNDITAAFDISGVGNATGCSDTSQASFTIEDVSIVKTLVSPAGGTVEPGDIATFSLRMDIPSGDTNDIIFDDYFPFPVFDVAGLSTDTNLGTNPDIAYGGADTLGLTPDAITVTPADNRLRIEWPDVSTAGPQVIEVLVSAEVSNDPFADNLTLSNLMQAETDNTPVDNSAALSTQSLLVRSPSLDITKTVTSTASGLQPTDSVTYDIVVSNLSTAEAYDVIVSDDEPAGLTNCALDSTTNGTGAGGDSPFDGDGFEFTSFDGPTLTALDGGESVTLTVSCDIDLTVAPSQTITNTASATWAAAPGATAYQPVTTTADVTTAAASQPAKSIIATSESATAESSPRPIAQGEIVRFRMSVEIPEGTHTNVRLVDLIPAGLRFLDDGTANIAFVSTSSGAISATSFAQAQCAAGTLERTGALAGITPDCELPAFGGTFNSGTDVTLNIGDVLNDETDADAEFIVLELNAVALGNQTNGTTNSNRFRLQTDEVTVTSPNVQVQHVLPELTTSKAATPTTVDAEDLVTYTVTVEHSGDSQADAFDLTFTDTLDGSFLENFAFIGGPVAPTGETCSAAGSAVVDTSDPFGAGISITFDALPQGDICEFSYSADTQAGLIPGSQIDNTADVAYDTLAGAGDPGNTTGSTPGAQGSFNADDTASVDVASTTNEKSLDSTSFAHTSDSETGDASGTARPVSIGEIVRYRLEVRLPEGSAPAFTVTDTLPDGMTYQAGTARLAFLAEGAGISATPGISCLNAGTLSVVGDENDLVATDPDCEIAATGGPFASGTDPVFALGDLMNDDMDVDLEYVIVEFDAIVDNVAGNQQAVELENTFDLTINGSSIGTTTSAFVEVVEPQLACSITATPNPVDNRVDATPTISLTYTLTNNGLATGFQAGAPAGSPWLIDLPAGFENINSLAVTPTGNVFLNGTATPVSASNFSVGGTDDRDLTANTTFEFAPAASLQVQFDATLQASVEPGDALADTCVVAYRGQASGNASNGYRDDSNLGTGSGNDPITSASPLNDYRDEAVLTLNSVSENPELGLAKRVSTAPVNNGDGTYSLAYTIVVENSGDVGLESVAVADDLAATFSGASFVVDDVTVASASGTLVAQPGFTGSAANTALLDASTSTLPVGESGTIVIEITVTPGTNLGPYNNAATGAAQSDRSSTTVNDISADGALPDANGNGNPGDDATPTPVTFSEAPVIGLAKQVISGPTNNGDGTYDLTYRFFVENFGDVVLDQLQLVDDLDATFGGATSFAVTALSSSDFTVNFPGFTGTAGNTNMLTGVDTLAAGASGEVAMTVRIEPGANLGPYNNQATVNARSPANTLANDVSDNAAVADQNGNGSPGDDGDPTPISFVEGPRIGLAKSISAGPTNNGDGTYTLQYTFVLENAGDVDLDQLSITDDLGARLSGVTSFVVDAVTSTDFTVNFPGYDGTAANADLLAPGNALSVGESGALTLDLTVTPGANLGPYNNFATATGESPANIVVNDLSDNGLDPDGDNDSDPNNDGDPTPTLFAETPGIGLAKSVSVGPTNNGDGTYDLSYQFVVANTGDVNLTNASVIDDLATTFGGAAFTVQNLQSADIGVNFPGFDGAADTELLAPAATLGVGQTAVLTLAIQVTPGANLGPFSNTALAEGESPAGTTPQDTSDDGVLPDGNGNGDPTDDSDPTVVTFAENPQIGLAKAVDSGPTNNGDGTYSLSYRLVVENSGDVDLANIQVIDDLSSTFAGAAVSVDALTSADVAVNFPGYDGVADTNLLAAGVNLDVGASVSVVLSVTVTPGNNLGPYANSATVSGESPAGGAPTDTSDDGAQPDGNGNGDPTDDDDPTIVVFAEDPRLGVAKSATEATPNYDNTFTSTVTLTIENLGDIAVNDVQIDEPLAANLAPATVVSVSNIAITGDLTALGTFDGVGQTGVLSGNEILPVGGAATVTFDLTYNLLNGGVCAVGPLSNQVSALGSSPAGTALSDVSQPGLDPDPDGDGDPSNNDAATAMVFALGNDGALTADAEVLPGDSLAIEVVDADQNRDSAAIEQILIVVTNLTNGEVETVLATETGAATGVFSAVLPTAQGGAAGANDDGQLTVLFEDAYHVSYQDSLSANGCAAEIAATGRVSGLATLSGNAWLDSDTDDVFDIGERPLEGWVIEVRDAAGNVVATVAVAADGSYTVPDLTPGAGYSVTLVHPDSGVVFGMIEDIDLPPDTTVLDQNLPIDPSGVVYDAVTRDAIPDVTVRLVDSDGNPLPAACLLPGQQNQVTAADGLYRFDLLPDADPACPSGGTYFVEFDVPDGYQDGFSELIPPESDPLDPTGLGDPVRVGDTGDAPQGGQSTRYFTAFTLSSGDPNVVFNHIPIDPLGVETSSVRLTKRVDRPTTTIGSLLAYTITIENLSPVALPAITVADTTPPGFSFVEGSALLDGQSDGFITVAGRPVRFEGIDLAPGQRRTLRYLLRVGAGVTQGAYINTAIPLLNDRPIGNDDTAEVEVIADPDFEETSIIGKVWHDRDGDGWQDSADATGLVISGGPFGAGVPVADLSGRRSESDNLERHLVTLTVPFSEEQLTLTSAEGTRLTLTATGSVAEDHVDAVAAGRNTQALMLARDQLMSAPSETRRTIESSRTVTLDEAIEPVRFESGKAAIPPAYVERLRAVLDSLSDKKNLRLSFIGHTDNERLSARTAAVYGDNQGLSESRARTVAQFMREALGLGAEQVSAAGKGEREPIASNATRAGMALNRRVEILFLYDEVETQEIVEMQAVAPAPTGEMKITITNYGISEEGLAGVRLATVEGLVIETDAKGRYHIAGVDGGFMERGRNFIVKVDAASLPSGTRFTTENPRVKRITQGLLSQFDFGVQLPQFAERTMVGAAFEIAPEFFTGGTTEIRAEFRGLFDELIETLTQQGGGRVVVLMDAGLNQDLLAMQRARALTERLRRALPAEVWAQVDVAVFAPQKTTAIRKTHWLQRIAAVLGGFLVSSAHADELCSINDCVVDGTRITRMLPVDALPPTRTAPPPDAEHGRFTVGLPGGGVLWLVEDASDLTPRLAVQGPSIFPVDREGIPAQDFVFLAYTNYGAFIANYELAIYREADVDRVKPLALLAPLSQPGAFTAFATFVWQPGSNVLIRADERLAYVLRVRDINGAADETRANFMQGVSAETFEENQIDAQKRSSKRESKDSVRVALLPELASLPTHEATRLIMRTYGRSQLIRQNMLLTGARVRLQGQDMVAADALFVNGQPLPIDIDGQTVAEFMLPIGKHHTEVAVMRAGAGTWLRDIPIQVIGNHSFLVALADLTASSNSLSGSLEPLSANDRYAEDTLVEGRVAFYLKAKIQGKYLLTGQLDSREEQLEDILGALDETDTRSLFRRLDPDRYYPVYGDDSTTVNDVDSLGRLYVRLDWNKSRVLWGNYQTALDGNEFTQYRRSLYGGSYEGKSVATTSNDDVRTTANLFASEVQTALGHVEFLGTGGSIYYLRHLDVIPGSDQARIEIRDPDSNRVVDLVELARGRDYEIDELQGRIILGKPLLQIAVQASPSLIRKGPLDGNFAILVVDYEYAPQGLDANEVAAGGQLRNWFGDHVALGLTAVTEGRGSEDYSLGGADLTLKAGNGTYLKLEAASSEATQTDRLYSTDGGLSFQSLNSAAVSNRSGEAVGLEMRANFEELGWTQGATTAAAWWRRVDDQFSVARRDDGVDTIESGLEIKAALGDRTTLSARVAEVEREAQLTESDYALQLDYQLGQAGTVSAEVRALERTGGQLQQGEEATLGALAYTHQFNDRLSAYVIGQGTLDNDGGNYDNNDLATVGAHYALNDKIAVIGDFSTGHRGDGAALTLEYDLNADHTLYSTLTHSTDRTDSPFSTSPGSQGSGFQQERLLPGNAIALGHRSRISNQLDVFNETSFSDTRGPVTLGHIFGLTWAADSGLNAGITMQKSDVNAELGLVERSAYSISGGYRSARVRWTSRVEYRDDQSVAALDDVEQWASINRLDVKFDDNWRLLTRLNFADTENTADRSANTRLIEGGLGIAYRPVDDNKLNWLAKYTYLYDLTSQGQVDFSGLLNERADQRSHILSLEGVQRWGPKWSLGAKFARRVSELRLQRDAGPWFDSTANFGAIRIRYHWVRQWDALLEYRALDLEEAQNRRSGWLIGVDRHVGDHMKVGIGYNFTDFSDDLTNLDYEFDGFFINLLGKY